MTNMRLICFQHLSASQITVHISTYSQAALALPIGNPFSSYQQLQMYTVKTVTVHSPELRSYKPLKQI
jgi:hypothetical protein